jgi:hypothetical protein
MSNDNTGGCCPGMKGLTKLTFFDGGQIAIVGLEEILAAVYAEGRHLNADTAEEIVKRVKEKNYIPSSA